MAPLLGRITPAQFLRRHWQRAPLLVREAFPGFAAPLTKDDLFALAARPDVESRLVLVRGGRRPFEVIDGPQDPRRLRRLPATHWTLLVQGVDRQQSAVAALLRPFAFLPTWRLDDVMVSFAPRGGSVGPHVDSYDVFLLQAGGRRRWEVDPRARPEFRPGRDLRILKRFRPSSSAVLAPGDMLYLPPGVGHHGVALEDGFTFSIGFRAPTGREVLAAALPERGRTDEERYRDPALARARHPGEITPAAVRGLRALAVRALDRDLETAVGELLTAPKHFEAPRRRPDPREVRRRVAQGAGLAPLPGTRVAFTRLKRDVILFAEGRPFPLRPGLRSRAPLVATWHARGVTVSAEALRAHLHAPGFADLLADLIAASAFALTRRRS